MGSLVAVTLSAAALLQLTAALLALRAMPHSGGYRYPWIAVSLALLLMVERRVEPLLDFHDQTTDLLDGLYALAISALMVFGMLGLDRLLRSLRSHEEHLQRLATTDALTGLANRRHVLEELERELQRCDRTGKPLAILMIDLDHFKEVNDRLGHAVGDVVLAEVAARCRARLRAVDLCGRLGGEEFLVVLPEADAAGAEGSARRLCADLAEHPVETDAGPLRVTVSIGVADYTPRAQGATSTPAPSDRLRLLLRSADRALYRAKEGGRNRVSSAMPEAWALATPALRVR
jgi:diguanylate cyclase (GGDEF)-like protein